MLKLIYTDYGRCYVRKLVPLCTFLKFHPHLEVNSARLFQNVFMKCSRVLNLVFSKKWNFSWTSPYFEVRTTLRSWRWNSNFVKRLLLALWKTSDQIQNVKLFFRQFVKRNVENCLFVWKKSYEKLLLMCLDKFVDFSLNIVLRDFFDNDGSMIFKSLSN